MAIKGGNEFLEIQKQNDHLYAYSHQDANCREILNFFPLAIPQKHRGKRYEGIYENIEQGIMNIEVEGKKIIPHTS